MLTRRWSSGCLKNTLRKFFKMNLQELTALKLEIISIGKLLWDKDLASGLNGNLSHRIDSQSLLLTAHATCLGLLKGQDILAMKVSGEMLDKGQVSTEKLLHTEIYKNFPDVKAVMHTHTTYTNAYFLKNEIFKPSTFEARMNLGEVTGIKQLTPAVTDAQPVIEALKKNNVVALCNHGVVAMGQTLFDGFVLIQTLEEQIKVEALSRLFQDVASGQWPVTSKTEMITGHRALGTHKKYKLFAQDQIDEIVRLVNGDTQLQELGTKTQMNMNLAVKLNETGAVYSFKFNNGKIVEVGNDSAAEFLISAPENIWRQVFNREIDPFVATTQKKMNLRGDFARISKWYAPCSRIFQLWAEVPVE